MQGKIYRKYLIKEQYYGSEPFNIPDKAIFIGIIDEEHDENLRDGSYRVKLKVLLYFLPEE